VPMADEAASILHSVATSAATRAAGGRRYSSQLSSMCLGRCPFARQQVAVLASPRCYPLRARYLFGDIATLQTDAVQVLHP